MTSRCCWVAESWFGRENSQLEMHTRLSGTSRGKVNRLTVRAHGDRDDVNVHDLAAADGKVAVRRLRPARERPANQCRHQQALTQSYVPGNA